MNHLESVSTNYSSHYSNTLSLGTGPEGTVTVCWTRMAKKKRDKGDQDKCKHVKSIDEALRIDEHSRVAVLIFE